jgi:uncharacterized protein YkwD
MLLRLFKAFPLLMLLVQPGIAAAMTQADVNKALNEARRQCDSSVTSQLRSNAQLMKAAAKASKGTRPADAAYAVGYEMTQLASLHLQGPATAAELQSVLQERSCEIVADADAREFGFYARGTEIWILVGAARGNPGKPAIAARRALMLVNNARAQGRTCGTTVFAPAMPLQLNLKLIKAAQAHAEEMARRKYVEHEGKDGSTPASRASKAGYTWKVVGENVAAGEGNVELVIDDWLNSPNHCENIMDPRFTEMGIAYSINSGDRQYGVYWTQTFGSPKTK